MKRVPEKHEARVRTNIRMLFPGLSRTRSIHKHVLHEVKKVPIQNQLSVYLHYRKEAEMQYLRWYYFI